MSEQIGNISNLVQKKQSKPPTPPSRIEVVEGRVATLESALKTVLSELTALREDVDRLKTSRTDAPQGKNGFPRPSETAKPPKEPPPKENTATPTDPSAKVEAKPPATETQTQPPPPKKSKRTRSGPWDDPDIRKELEACRPRIRALLVEEKEITKAGCAEKLGIDASLAGRTLSYMMTQTNEVRMISPPKTPEDPDPKKRFRLIT